MTWRASLGQELTGMRRNREWLRCVMGKGPLFLLDYLRDHGAEAQLDLQLKVGSKPQ